jgi:hypothetical protein
MRPASSTCVWVGLSLAGVAIPAVAQAAPADDRSEAQDEVTRLVAAAQVREAKGELIPAAMALERLLAIYPDAADARLYYASLLCKLTNQTGAGEQIAMLDGQTYQRDMWARMTAACGPMARPRSHVIRYGLTGELTAGVAYDSDVLGSLAVQFTVPGFVGPAQEASSLTGSAKLAGNWRAGKGYVYTNVSGRTKNDFAGRRSDYQLGEIAIGFGAGSFSAGAVARYAQIVEKRFVTELGVQGEANVSAGAGQRLTVRGEVVHQDYAASTAQFSRNGARFDASVHFESQGRGGISWVGGGAFELKNSKARAEGYVGGRVFAGARVAIGSQGTYANLSGTYRFSRFLNAPAAQPRHDRRLLGRIAFGTPLGLRGIVAEAATSYTDRRFSLATGQRSVSNIGTELRLIWKFGR